MSGCVSHNNTNQNMRAVLLLSLLATCDSLRSPPKSPPFSRGWAKESEKKHGRVALLAVPSLIAISTITSENPFLFLNNQPVETQLISYSIAGLLETLNLFRFERGFNLKRGELPGKLLPFNASKTFEEVEDWSGRVAMLSSLLLVGQWV